MGKKRNCFSGRQKLEIVIEGMRTEGSISEVCRRHGISPTLYYRWRDQLLNSAEDVSISLLPDHEDFKVQSTYPGLWRQ